MIDDPLKDQMSGAPAPEASPADWDATIQDVSDWLVAQVLGPIDIARVLDGVSARLLAAGVPLLRTHVAMRTLHPMFQAVTFTWYRDRDDNVDMIPHSETDSEDWLKSPIRRLVDEQLDEARFRMEGTESWSEYPLLVDLRAGGATDYFALATSFESVDRIEVRLDGMISSWVTDRPGGFSDAEISAIQRLQLRLAAATKAYKGEQTAVNILTAYLGGNAAQRVLEGQIKLGSGEVIPSVIWYSDLRQSTTLADTLPGEVFLAALNDYFACTAGAVLDHGGEVLRFIGDAVLAIFPVGDGDDCDCAEDACRKALAAAADAERRLAEVNDRRLGDGEPALAFGLGLHIGEVLFGNIGIPERVEFSVIGPAANETCRIEGLCKELDRTVIVSSEFAGHLDIAWQALGEHRFRGVNGGRRLFAPPV